MVLKRQSYSWKCVRFSYGFRSACVCVLLCFLVPPSCVPEFFLSICSILSLFTCWLLSKSLHSLPIRWAIQPCQLDGWCGTNKWFGPIGLATQVSFFLLASGRVTIQDDWNMNMRGRNLYKNVSRSSLWHFEPVWTRLNPFHEVLPCLVKFEPFYGWLGIIKYVRYLFPSSGE